MSPRPIVLDPDLQALQDEGLRIEVTQGHLLVHAVPYVTSRRTVARGILVTNLAGTLGRLGPPPDHQVWFAGEFPCHADGTPIEAIRHSSGSMPLWSGFEAKQRFSNKPAGQNGFASYADKMRHYLALITPHARAIDPEATPRVFDPILAKAPDHVLRYWDTASSRAGILAATEKLTSGPVGIVGLGGTGAYVLDQVAKVAVPAIHLFDGDRFEQHSAFRAPGAATLEEIESRPLKVEYFARRYDAMHAGIVPHPVFIDEDELGRLDACGFVFLCVDKGGARKLIGDYLAGRGIPFVDTGMDLSFLTDEGVLLGACRATLCSPRKADHFGRRAPLGAAVGNDLYRSNIQVADMNMLNAALAVMMWKKHLGFYLDHWRPHHTVYSLDAHALTRDEMLSPPADEG